MSTQPETARQPARQTALEPARQPAPPPGGGFDPTAGHVAVLRERGLLPDGFLAVYAAGSLVRGWGNRTSDLDFYVVLAEPWSPEGAAGSPVALVPDAISVTASVVDGRRWDVEYWLDTQVDQVLAKVDRRELDSGRPAGSGLTYFEIDFLERLRHGCPVSGTDWFTRRRRQLDASALDSIMTARALTHLDIRTEDAVGQLDAGDTEAAVLSARIGFGAAVEALLASAGEIGESEKWRARRLRAVRPAVLSFDRYWELETMRTFDPGQPGQWVREVLEVCQDIAMEVEL